MIPIYYSFRRCPYAMRARMALAYANIKVEHREILLKKKPQSMLQYSPKGTVPVLVVGDSVIDESLAIMHWALEHNDRDNWLLNDDRVLQKEMRELITLNDEKFKPQLDHYKYSDRHELSEESYRNQSEWFLELLNNKLSKQYYLIGKKITMADIAIFPVIRQYAFVNKTWFDQTAYCHLQKWLENHIQSSLFQSIMHKHSLWVDYQKYIKEH